MSRFVVYSIPGSPFGRAVLATLEEKGATYRLSPVMPGGFRAPEHLTRHPFGRVPVLDHDGFMLYETQAILRYLDRILPEPDFTPANPKLAGRMDQVMNVCDWYLFQGAANIICFQRLVGPRLLGLTADEAAVTAALPKARAVLAELARLLGNQACFAGERLSLADLALAPHVDFLSLTPEWAELSAPYANLVAWLTRMNARPSLQATTWERVTEMAKAA